MSEPCSGSKRSLGILISPPTINPPCDCYKDVLFPIGSLLGVFKNIGRKIFARQLLAFQLGLLRTPIAKAVQIRVYAQNILQGLKDKISSLSTELSKVTSDLKTWYSYLTEASATVNTLMQNLNDKLGQTRNIVGQIQNLLAGSSPNAIRLDPQTGQMIVSPGLVPNFLKNQFDALVSQYNTARAELSNLRSELLNAEIALEFVDTGLKSLQAKEKSLIDALGGIRGPAIQIGDDTIPSGTLVNQRGALDNLIVELQNTENNLVDLRRRSQNAISGGQSSDMARMVDEIDNKFSEIAAQAADYLLDLLSTLSTIQKVNCMESSMLNEETCQCTECPPDKELCGGSDSGLQGLLPSLPGIRSGSEKNTCVDRCCPGLVLASNNVGNCYCICEDSSQTIKPCNSADCVAKVTCASPPPDSSELGWFGVSKYEWDADECDWVCKDNPCDHSCCDDDEYCCGTECCPNDNNCCEGVCCASGEICCNGACCSGDCEENTCCATGLSLSHLYKDSIIP